VTGTDRTTDVIVMCQGAGGDSVAATLAALAATPAGLVGRVVLVGDGADADSAAAATAEHALQVTHAARGTSADLHADGRTYVAVIRAGDVLSPAALQSVADQRRSRQALRLYALVPTDPEYRLSRRVRTKTSVSTEREPTVMWCGTSGLVIRADVLGQCALLDLSGPLGASSLFLEAALLLGRYAVLADAVTCGEPLEDALTVEACLFDPDWYHGLNDYFHRLFSLARGEWGGVPQYLQHCYLYLLGWRITYNRNTANKMVLRDDDLSRFGAGVLVVLADVTTTVLFTMPAGHTIDRRVRLVLQSVRDGERPSYRYYSDDIALVLRDEPLVTASGTPLDVELMDATDGALRVSGRYLFPVDGEVMRLVATYRGKDYEVAATPRMSDSTAFGVAMYRTYTFDVSIPLSADQDGGLAFALVAEGSGSRVQLELRFRRHPSKLAANRRSYWATDTHVFKCHNRRVQIQLRTRDRVRNAEARYLLSLVASRQPEQIRAAWLRVLYLLTRRWFARRPIWIYFDKIYKAGDNGEYAYRYAAGRSDGIGKYYILQGDVPDARRLKAAGVKTVRYDSLLHKLLYLNADIVFTTHITPPNFGGFQGGFERHFRGLFDYQLVCIQHGLSVQDLSDTLNQVYDNTKWFCLASPVERENLSQPAYQYQPENLVMTGLARYDGLVPDDKRRILISPTWRNYLAAPATMGRSRRYSEAFANSVYCTLYNSLISHPKLLQTARERGYSITLLLHPVTSSQIADFPANDVVDVVASAGEFDYESALTEASLMVTDYSGIQFDFAYMYKPVVYLHVPELPAAYSEGSYRYDTMALGDICHDVDSLVDTVCEYMRTDCALKDEYRKRIDKFFAFHDRSSSARIYDLGRTIQRALP